MSDETLEVFIEVPMGSRNKYEWDFERQTFVLDRMLFTAVRYPGDYGFIPTRWPSTATTSMPS
jgi:inorganic pyrophosphatase